MKNRTLVLCLTIALSAMMAITGTLAYLQDQDEAVNVMTLGSVYIDQIEQEYNADGELVEFKQNKPLYPFVGVNNGWEAADYEGGAYRRLANMENVVDKYVSVKNTGKSDAYVRTIIALEMGSMSYDDLCNTISASANVADGTEFKFPGAWVWPFDGVATIDGKTYNVMVAVHQDAVKPGETTIPSLLQVYMKSEAGNAEVEALDGNGNGLYDILVLSQAVQTAGFENAEAALDTAFGKVFEKDASGKLVAATKAGATETNLNAWFGGVTPVVSVASEKELRDALTAAMANGGTIVLTADIELEDEGLVVAADKTVTLDLGGHTLKQEKAQTGAYAMIDNKGTLTITGNGKISYADITEYTANNNHASNTIKNSGVLNVEGGIIENVSSDNVMDYGYPHAIDAYEGSVTNITGGTVKSANYDSIRMFCNSATLPTTVNISGGTIINRVSFQAPSSNRADYGILNISGGNFITTGDVNANVRLLNFTTNCTNMKATVTGGTFDKGFKTQDIANAGVQESDWLTIKKENIEQPVYVKDAAELENAFENAQDGDIIVLTGKVENAKLDAAQAADKQVTIDGNGNAFSGSVIVNGGSSAHESAGLVIKNLKFEGKPEQGDTYIHLGIDNTSRYVSNVTIENCQFIGSDNEAYVAIRTSTGGDKNVTVKNCYVGEKMHSLMQVDNIDGLTISDCQVYSKNGINLNATPNLVMDNCTFNVKGYAVRFGQGSGTPIAGMSHKISNSTLKSTLDDPTDSVIIFRGDAVNAKLELVNTKLEGASLHQGNADPDNNIIIH